MKKYIPLILVTIFFCIGFLFKLDLMQNSAFMSDSDRKMNGCVQILSLSPIFVGGGMALLLSPLPLIKWLTSVLGQGQPSINIIESFFLRLIGAIIIFAYIYSWINNCQGWLQSLFR
jgi:hypothetical protein